MPIVIRPMLKEDAEQVMALCSLVQPERAGDLKVYLRRFDEPGYEAEQDLRQWVAVESGLGQCVGYAAFWNVVRRKYRMDLMVHAGWRKRRVGSQLLETMQAALQTTPAATLQARALDDSAESLQFLDRRGFREIHRMVELQLKLSDANFSPFARLPARLAAQGVQFNTWRLTSMDTQFWERLTDLQRAAADGWPDPDPDGEITRASEDQVRRMFAYWQTAPDAFWLAQADGLYIGYSALGPDNRVPEAIGAGPTAVRPEYRGRGIATALKTLCLNYARAQGWRFAVTRSANPAMIRVNEKFGFERGRSEVRLVKKLQAETP
jgi:GNAT superfamily N-acetyltransferase